MALKAEEAAPIFERLDGETQEALVEQMGIESIAPIVFEMAADDRTDLIEALPDQVSGTLLSTLEKVDPEAAAEVEELAKWPEDSAGGLTTTDYVSVGIHLKVADAIERIRAVGEDAETIYYVYIVSDRGGTSSASCRCAICCSPRRKLADVRQRRTPSASDRSGGQVARTSKYDFNALPVLSADQSCKCHRRRRDGRPHGGAIEDMAAGSSRPHARGQRLPRRASGRSSRKRARGSPCCSSASS